MLRWTTNFLLYAGLPIPLGCISLLAYQALLNSNDPNRNENVFAFSFLILLFGIITCGLPSIAYGAIMTYVHDRYQLPIRMLLSMFLGALVGSGYFFLFPELVMTLVIIGLLIGAMIPFFVECMHLALPRQCKLILQEN